jgi:hypothetical protein
VDKVIGGTPKTQPSLCLSCEHSLVIKSPNLEQRVFCGILGRFEVPFVVIECNNYNKKGEPSKYEMEKIAWTVETRNRGPKGFVKPLEENEVVISPPKKKNEEEF